MAELTRIDGIPVYTTLAEALAYGVSNGLTGYHTHEVNGVTGYMAGSTHAQATSSNGVDPFSSAGGNGELQNSTGLGDNEELPGFY